MLLDCVFVLQALKKEEASFVRLLLRMLSVCAEEAGGEAPSAAAAGLAHVRCMVADDPAVGGFKRRQGQRQKAARAFVGLLPRSRPGPVVTRMPVLYAREWRCFGTRGPLVRRIGPA